MKKDSLPGYVIELALWLVWKGYIRQAYKGCPVDMLDGFHPSEIRKAADTNLVSLGMKDGEQVCFATKPAVRSVVKWLYEGFDPIGRSMAPYWSGRLRRKYGIGPSDDLDLAMKNCIR